MHHHQNLHMKHATLIPLFFRFAHSRTSMSLIRSPTGVSIQGLVTFHPLPAFTFFPTQAGFSGRDYDHAPGNILHLLGISRPIVFNWKTKTSLFCSSFHVPAAQQLDIDSKYHMFVYWFHLDFMTANLKWPAPIPSNLAIFPKSVFPLSQMTFLYLQTSSLPS